jgi:hypothetical protein
VTPGTVTIPNFPSFGVSWKAAKNRKVGVNKSGINRRGSVKKAADTRASETGGIGEQRAVDTGPRINTPSCQGWLGLTASNAAVPVLICCFSPMLICATFGLSSLRTCARERIEER